MASAASIGMIDPVAASIIKQLLILLRQSGFVEKVRCLDELPRPENA